MKNSQKDLKAVNIQLFKERYCYKCHKIQEVTAFSKKLPIFRIAGVCLSCTKRH